MAQDYIPAVVPVPGQVISVVLQFSTFGVLCVCITIRSSWLKNWRTLPLSIWLILMIYVDSSCFVLAASILAHGLGINSSRGVCEAGILLCLGCYMTTKILIYYFLVERAYIVRGSRKPRLKTKLWLFNCLFMILPYTVIVVLNFVWRITYINDKGVCIIGMEMKAMLPLITFELIVNVYLTLLFVLPLRQLYSYRHSTNPRLKRMAFRSLIGSLCTLTASVANQTVLMVSRGEPGYICLMCCNADILFCVVVMHWVTSIDQPNPYGSTPPSRSGPTGAQSGAWKKAPPQQVKTTVAGPAPGKTKCLHAKHDVDIVHTTLDRMGSDLSDWPHGHAIAATAGKLSFPGTVTTEIHSSHAQHAGPWSKNGLVLLRSGDDGGRGGDGVELHKIHVQREVCIDSESGDEMELHGQRGVCIDSECGDEVELHGQRGVGGDTKSESSRESEGDAERGFVRHSWGGEKSVSAEKMV